MPRPGADAREAELLEERPRLTSDRSIPKRSRTTRLRSTQRQRTTPSVSGSGPVATSCLSTPFCSSDNRAGRPGGLMSISPSGPCWLKRCTQSRSVCRSIPPIRAASARVLPSRTAAKASSRRACAASFTRAARRRRSSAAKSSRSVIAPPISASESIRSATIESQRRREREPRAGRHAQRVTPSEAW